MIDDEEILELIAKMDELPDIYERCDLCMMHCVRRTKGTNPYPCDKETRRRLREMGRRLYQWRRVGRGRWKRVM